MGRNDKGFTLLEMLVVLFIIGVILAIAIPNLAKTGDTAQSKAEEANIQMLEAQAENYRLAEGSYPDTVKELVDKGYIRSAPKCKNGKDFIIQEHSGDEGVSITIKCGSKS